MKSLQPLFSVLTLVFLFTLSLPLDLMAQTLNDDGSTYTINANGSLQQNGSVQDYTIPSNPIYNSIRFALRGGDGGFAKAGNNCQSNGGEGATTTVVFWVGNGTNELKPGGTIRFIVGKYGENGDVGGTSGTGAGAGGGTAVLYRPDASSNWEILAVAGGGGGAYQGNIGGGCVDSQAGQGGRSLTGGGNGEGPNAGSGGTNGDGGEGADAVNNILSGGGGGAFSDGGENGGKAGFPNGGNGGVSGNEGGYGFGGGGWGGAANSHGGGGGGGYSGGGGGGTANNGGGGGSYVNANYNLIYSQKSAGSTGGGNEVNGDVDYTFEDTEIVWTGAVDDDWHDSGNWAPARVPQLIDVVDINAAANDPIILASNQANAKVVRVFSGGDLTIGTNAVLNIEPIDRNGIFNEGTITNDGGEINISGYDNVDGIRNDGGTFINKFAGVINIEDMDRYGIYNQNGTFNNNTGGTINIGTASSPIGDDGIQNDPGCTFINSGTLKIRNTTGIGIENHGSFTSNANADILIDQSLQGINNRINSSFVNHGTITIGSITAVDYDGIWNEATFNNFASGTIIIENVGTNGISHFLGTFTNEGLIKIGENGSITDYAIFAEQVFINSGCDATIHIFDKHIQDPQNNFTNNGNILQESNGNSNIYTNNGAIFYNAGSFTADIGNTPVSISGTFAVKKLWTGCDDSDWDNALNWHPAGVPTSSDDVVIHPVGSFLPNLNSTTTALSQSVSVENGATLFNNGSLAVSGGIFEIKSGATSIGNGQYTLSGNFRNDGTFTAGVSTVSFVGTSNHQYIWAANPTTFYNLVIDRPSNLWVKLIDEVTVLNDLPLSSGILEVQSSGILTVHNLSVENGGTLENQGMVSTTNIGNSLWIQSGGHVYGSGQYTLKGNFLLEGGTFTPGTSTVTMTGNFDNTISSDPLNFYNLWIDKPNDKKITLNSDVTVTNALYFSSGDLEVSNGISLSCPTMWLENDNDLYNNGSITITGNYPGFWIPSGASAQGDGQYYISGDLAIEGGNFIPGSSTVIMNGTTDQLLFSDPLSFYNLTINKPSGMVFIGSVSAIISNELNMISGNLDLAGSDVELTNNGAILGESAASYIYSTGGGVVKTTVSLNAPTSENPGNIGATITSAGNLGSTIIQRGHEVQDVNGNVSIVRYYDISPANNSGLDATVRFHYLDHELNGLTENDLSPYRYNGTTWDQYSIANNDAMANWVETTNVDAFSKWTLAKCISQTFYADTDGDGFGDPAVSISDCTAPSGYVNDNTDCDDSDANEFPGQTWYEDADSDGYTTGTVQVACERPTGYRPASELVNISDIDCNDSDPDVNPNPDCSTITRTWTGHISTDWNEACNWSPNCVPTANDDVVIPNKANDPIISGGTAAVAKSVRVNISGMLTIQSSASLDIDNAANDGLFLNSQATLINYGDINIGATATGGNGIKLKNDSQLTNDGGTIDIQNTNSRGIQLEVETNFNNINGGQVLIGQTGGSIGGYGIYLLDETHGWNNNNSTVIIDNTTQHALRVQNSTIFTNQNNGELLIGQNDGNIQGSGISISDGTLRNYNAILRIDNTTQQGVEVTTGTIDNKNGGEVYIGEIGNVVGNAILMNSGQGILNQSCSLIKATKPIYYSSTPLGTNHGIIIEEAGGTSRIQTNNGVIQNLGGGSFNITNNNGTLSELPDDVVWTGCGDTQWSNADNWHTSTLPTTSSDVIIPNATNAPVISSGFTALSNGLVIETGATLTNNGKLRIVSPSTGDLWIKNGGTLQGDGEYDLDGDWINDGSFQAGTSKVDLYGTNQIKGSSQTDFYLLIFLGGTFSLETPITVSNLLALAINSTLNLNGYDITLLGNASVAGEDESNYIYSTGGGLVKTTVSLNAPTEINPGNLGVTITSSADLGSTTIERRHDVQDVNGEVSIVRTYDISPTNNSGLDATVRFHYLDHELNGIAENDLAPFRYNGSTWDDYAVSAIDATDNWVETTNVDAFSVWTLAGSSAVLPVELNYFSATKRQDDVLLTWQTATETDNEGFEVEHSTDGRNWDYLDFVNGHGTSFESHDYQFTHESPSLGTNYYRLRQVDFDGNFEYSNIRYVAFDDLDHQIKIFPNPATTQTNIQLPNDFKRADITVFDIRGRIVFFQEQEGGQALQGIEVANWQSGLYLVRVQVDGRVSTQKLQVH